MGKPSEPDVEPQPVEAQARFRVLAIDDDKVILHFVREFLKSLPIEVETALSGPEGLLKLRRFHPHLVLLDVEMPGVDGFEVCARIRALGTGIPRHLLRGGDTYEAVDRADPEDRARGTAPLDPAGVLQAGREDDKGIHVIFLTARNTADDVVRAHDVGADGFIRKPFEVEEFKRRVADALGLSS